MARRERQTAAQAWLEKWNPLTGMSIREAQAIFDAARGGDTQRLHWLFQEIEATNPVLLVCVERRASALANFRWKVSEAAASDGALSAEQKDAAERLLNGVENLTDALEHLDLAFFRGFAHAQPVWETDGTVREINLLDSWKFVRKDGAWFYNPACTGLAGDLQATDRCGLMTIVRRRPVDYPALGLHIRHAVGSRDWGRFLERYALPKPAAFMHPGATEEQKGDYLEAANAVENGQVSVWPNGASLTDFAGGSRGTDPFNAFIEHQEKQIVLLATGGTLMSLAEAGTGTLAGGAQSEVWESIVARDASVVAQAVQRALVAPCLARAFPGRPCTVRFSFDFSKAPTAKEVFEVAALAKQAGWTIDKAQLEEQTGYTLVQDAPQQLPAGGFSASSPAGGTPFMNKAPAPGAEDGVLAAFAQDTGPAAEAVRALLADPSPEAARKLLDGLPSLIPDDPALAAVLAEEMAKEFQGAAVANKTDANGQEHADAGSGNGGQFVSKDGGKSSAPSEKTEDGGLKSSAEYRKLADSVPKSRIDDICSVSVKQTCTIEEAIAVLRTNPRIKNAFGKEVVFESWLSDKYLDGRKRAGNTPDPERLKDLPIAMFAVAHDMSPKLQFLRGAINDPLNPPKGTQRVYTVNASRGPMLARAWEDSGKVQGWYVETKKPTSDGGGRKRA